MTSIKHAVNPGAAGQSVFNSAVAFNDYLVSLVSNTEAGRWASSPAVTEFCRKSQEDMETEAMSDEMVDKMESQNGETL